jgi:hypothetical protein
MCLFDLPHGDLRRSIDCAAAYHLSTVVNVNVDDDDDRMQPAKRQIQRSSAFISREGKNRALTGTSHVDKEGYVNRLKMEWRGGENEG